MFVIRRVCVVTETERKEKKEEGKRKTGEHARPVRTAKHGIVCFACYVRRETGACFSRWRRSVLRLFALGLACSVVFSRSFVLDNKNIVQSHIDRSPSSTTTQRYL